MDFFEIEYRVYNKDINMNDYHSHKFYEIYFLEKGQRRYFVGSEMYEIKDGTLVIIPPYIPHKTEGSVFKRYLISFERDYVPPCYNKIFSLLCSKRVLVFNKESSNTIIHILQEIIAEYNNKKHYHNIMVECHLIRLFCRALRDGVAIEQSRIIENNDKANRIIYDVVQFINNNLGNKITLTTLSEKHYISKSHLSRKFSMTIKQSISQYITIARINKATYLIKNTNLSMQQIAEMTGFKSANYMNCVFLKHLNISPVKYKHNMS